MAGLFIAFEGIDGSGKSTQLERFVAWARDHDADVLQVREPGGTQIGERVRALLLDPATGNISGSAEALLYAAARAELVERVIAPALAAGRIVVADRYVDSSLAYQGAGRGLGVDRVLAANTLATGELMPDAAVLVRVDASTAARRVAASADGPPDRIEQAGKDFFERVVGAYDELAERYGDRFVVVDGTRDQQEIHLEVVAALRDRVLATAGAAR